AVAAHVADTRTSDPSALERTIASHIGDGGVIAIAVFGPGGEVVAQDGAEDGTVRAPPEPYGEAATRTTSASGRVLDVVLPSGTDAAVVVRVRAEDDPARTAQLVRGIALYMFVFALGLLVFAYIALTRAIV